MLRSVLLIALAAGSATATTGHSLSVFNDGRAEFVTIQAPADRAIQLGGWVLVSAVGDQKVRLPAAALPPGGAVRVVSGTTAARAADILWTRQNVWNNDGDVARLFDTSGTLVAEHAYGAAVRTASALKASSIKGTRTGP